MFHNAVMLFACGFQGSHLDHGIGEMPPLCGNGMPLCHRHLHGPTLVKAVLAMRVQA